MSVKVKELMSEQLITLQKHHTVEHARNLLQEHGIGAIPVVGSEGEPLGIVSATDLAADLKSGTPVSKLMSGKVYTVPLYADVHIAARVMRNQKIHRVLVTHEKKATGILSAFDLLTLVEDHRFVMKQAPTPSKRKRPKIA